MSVETLEKGARELAPVWRALADPTRREILDLLRVRPMTTGELCGRFELSRFGVMKHLELLVDAGLVIVRREGRRRFNRLNPVPIRQIYRRWIRPFETRAADGLLRLKQFSEESAMSEGNLRAIDIQMEIRINAPREKVWDALTSGIAEWWPATFYMGSDPKGFVVEPKVGGRVFEDSGNGDGVLWATIVQCRNQQLLQWAGDIPAEMGGPARSLISYNLSVDGKTTVLKFRDTTFGHVPEALEKAGRAGWKTLFEEMLVAWVEEGKRPERPKTVKT